MWVWEVVDEVEPITCFIYQTLGSYFYVAIILPCYARRRGLGLSVSMTDVSCKLMVQLKVATLIHIWVDCWFGHLGIYQCCPRRSRGYTM